jgi:hypothetical protein
MMSLLAKLGEPSDCTLCGMVAPLAQVQVTVPPTATVSTAGLDDPLWSLRKKMSPKVTAAVAGAGEAPPELPPAPSLGAVGELLSLLQANRLAVSTLPTSSIEM